MKGRDAKREQSVSKSLSVTICVLWEASDGGSSEQITAETGTDSEVLHAHTDAHTSLYLSVLSVSAMAHTHPLFILQFSLTDFLWRW